MLELRNLFFYRSLSLLLFALFPTCLILDVPEGRNLILKLVLLLSHQVSVLEVDLGYLRYIGLCRRLAVNAGKPLLLATALIVFQR